MSESKIVNGSDLARFVRDGQIEGRAYGRALDVFRNDERWTGWAKTTLFVLGVAHVLAGIIFFFAYNWNGLSPSIKFGIVSVSMIVCVLLWIWQRLDSAVAQSFGIGATIMIGVFLAVFGQVFQTPAQAHAPFTFWAILAFPFALMSRSLAHWAVWVVIACIAALALSVDTLEPHFGESVAALFILCVSALIFAASWGYGYLTKKAGSQPSIWFRPFLTIIAAGLAVTVFSTMFWSDNFLIALLAVGLLFGAFWSRYKSSPTLAGLSLLAFALLIVAAQIGLRVIFDMGDFGVFTLFFAFLWMVGLTFALSKAVSHFQDITASEEAREKSTKARSDEKTMGMDKSVSLATLSESLDLKLSPVVGRETDVMGPWYTELFLALAGLLAAVFASVFLVLLVGLFIDLDNVDILMGVSVAAFIGSLVARMKSEGAFSRHFFNTLMLGASLVAMAYFGLKFKTELPFYILGFCMAAASVILIRDPIIEFLGASVSAVLLICMLIDFQWAAPYVTTTCVLTAFGLICWLWPIGSRLFKSAGAAFLLAVPILYAIMGSLGEWRWSFMQELSMQDRVGGVIVCALAIIATQVALGRLSNPRPPWWISACLLIVMALFPVGGAAALFVILLGYMTGSHTLAIIGLLVEAWFLYQFYYDLNTTLLVKSGLLLVAGLILLGLWGALGRQTSRREALS